MSILIVDDSEINRGMLVNIFEKEYKTLEAEDGEEAIKILDRKHKEISLVFLDLVMPKKDGIEVLAYMKMKGYSDAIPVIVITADSTSETDFLSYEFGAADIIYKPFNSKVIIKRAHNLMELYAGRESMQEQLKIKTAALLESQKKLSENNEFLINALGSVVEFRSTESGAHVQRVKDFTRILLTHVSAKYPEYGLTSDAIYTISLAAALHDVGKIAIPDNILNKPGKLTFEEYEEMKKHTLYGCDILNNFKQENTEFFKYCYEICRWHHEKYDGGGYPDALKGEEIPIWAQVVAIADCFDALVSKRVYKKAFSYNKAFDMIRNGECGMFSDKVLRCFEDARKELVTLVRRSNSKKTA